MCILYLHKLSRSAKLSSRKSVDGSRSMTTDPFHLFEFARMSYAHRLDNIKQLEQVLSSDRSLRATGLDSVQDRQSQAGLPFTSGTMSANSNHSSLRVVWIEPNIYERCAMPKTGPVTRAFECYERLDRYIAQRSNCIWREGLYPLLESQVPPCVENFKSEDAASSVQYRNCLITHCSASVQESEIAAPQSSRSIDLVRCS